MPSIKAQASLLATGAWAGSASFLAIFLLGAFDEWLDVHGVASVTLIGSFGATAVLVYGAPTAEFSRFRNVVYGHGLSAAIGVSIALTLGSNRSLSAAFAVGAAVLVMHLTRTTHPPGGATALIAVTGGQRVSQLGYWYVLLPVMVGAASMYVLGYWGRRFGPRSPVVTPPLDEL